MTASVYRLSNAPGMGPFPVVMRENTSARVLAVESTMPDWVRQAGVIAIQDGRLCLVTSRNGRRWVLPKGLIDTGHTAGEAALVEAWEEAGLVGMLAPEPVGAYVYEKLGQEYHVLLFRMSVTEARDNWPERGLRQRAWVSPDEAIDRVEDPGLRDVLRLVFGVRHPDHIAVA